MRGLGGEMNHLANYAVLWTPVSTWPEVRGSQHSHMWSIVSSVCGTLNENFRTFASTVPLSLGTRRSTRVMGMQVLSTSQTLRAAWTFQNSIPRYSHAFTTGNCGSKSPSLEPRICDIVSACLADSSSRNQRLTLWLLNQKCYLVSWWGSLNKSDIYAWEVAWGGEFVSQEGRGRGHEFPFQQQSC